MKKTITTLLFGSVFLLPSFAFAQIPQEEYNTLIQQLIALLTERVESLQAQLTELRSQQDDEPVKTKKMPEEKAKTVTENPEPEAAESLARLEVESEVLLEEGSKWDTSTKDHIKGNAGKGIIKFNVKVFDDEGKYQKLPVTVATDYPGLPSTFEINNPGQQFWFCVADYKEGNNGVVSGGCPVSLPTYPGTFNFTFTSGNLSKRVTVEITE